ncbi:HlyD family efflux transporter periplasmic adaptor subunit [uncultured Aquabacterium sp.]|uniref:efflux RND transporter periplasmic adaptor subunit n=1 Tax=uncultured Aquabacterium sp. TaxID=158753 RepID=UPI002632E51D|nr:HlyD family efflux transporter periplasmic adaptor subunit [uncultured Aquabacterium sp.]
MSALLALGQQARAATTAQELAFLLVNVSHSLTPYRQAVLWLDDHGVHTLSGVVQIEANAPYVQWVNQICRHLSQQPEGGPLRVVRAADLPDTLAAAWHEWWPTYALWVRLPLGAVVLLRDDPWTAHEQWLWQDWAATWAHAWHALVHPRATGWRRTGQRMRQLWQTQPDRHWWQQTRVRVIAGVIAVLLCPVQLSVLAPGELVPSQPVVIRAPLEGVIDTFHVQPNQRVAAGTPLFGFDEALIRSRLDVATQALSTAETEYRQTSQQALIDARSKTQLALLTGKIEEKRAEVEYLAEQLTRARVLAPREGVVLMDDPSEWIGRPVSVGERILRIAAPRDAEVEAWVPLADAVPLPAGAPVKLYLHANPLSPVQATVRYMAHDAVARPDGQYAYRVRATLSVPTDHRVGLKGSAKLSAGWTPLGYWVLRRPLAALRTTLGI